jgi:hypothetical protein
LFEKRPRTAPRFQGERLDEATVGFKGAKDAAHAVKQQGFYAYKMKAEMKIPEGDLAARMLAAGPKKKK